MLTKTEMTLKNLRTSHTRGNSQQNKTAQRHVEQPQNVMFRRVAL